MTAAGNPTNGCNHRRCSALTANRRDCGPCSFAAELRRAVAAPVKLPIG